ncbi:CYFA0S22e00804g1_1 [Cyberlindnera fabianii]|nr:CYFA0S22e00804g1_1 [Cyberlindnera fabianii]
MSRFIPEGKSDLKALQANENKASSKFHEEEEEKEALSLYEQMKLNHMQKEQEYQEKVKARNQPHKIDEREHAYYEGLRFKEQEKESLRKRELEQGVEEFEK